MTKNIKSNKKCSSKIYEEFSKSEDYPNLVANYLKPKLRNKVVVDLGCGTGRHINLLSKYSKQYFGLDNNIEQLKIASKKTKDYKTILINAQAEKTGLNQNSIDIIISMWLFETIKELETKEKILCETERILKNKNNLYIISYSGYSEFDKIIRYKDNINTEKNKHWLYKNGFELIKTLKSYFLFPTAIKAKETFLTIHEKSSADRIQNRKIEHSINVYKKVRTCH